MPNQNSAADNTGDTNRALFIGSVRNDDIYLSNQLLPYSLPTPYSSLVTIHHINLATAGLVGPSSHHLHSHIFRDS